MSHRAKDLKIAEKNSELEVVNYDRDAKEVIVKHHQTGNICTIEDTFAEMFPMWVGRILITAATEEWALTSARVATGFASSIIMSPAEAGIEKLLQSNQTPDSRPGVVIQIYHNLGYKLKIQMMTRIGQCIMTCPTTSAFDAMEAERVKKLKIGRSLSLFGDGFQRKDTLGERQIWRIPVMEGEFIIEDRFSVKRGVAGGNILILAKDQTAALTSAEAAKNAINNVEGVVLTFPGGICRSGSKIGSGKYKLLASTNHLFCPSLRDLVKDTRIPEDVKSVYEIVVNGLDLKSVQKAIGEGITAAASIEGVSKITSANYGGKLGPYKAVLREILKLQ